MVAVAALTAVRMLIGLLFLAAGGSKAMLPPAARISWVRSLPVVPAFARNPVALLLPIVEISVGMLLLTGAYGPTGPIVAGLLLIAFTAATVVMLARGVEANCGCFGSGGKLSWRIVGRNVALIGGCALLAHVPSPWTVAGLSWPTQALLVAAGTSTLLATAWQRRYRMLARQASTAPTGPAQAS